jgi:hypothetical protein
MRKRQFLGSRLSTAGIVLVDGRRREPFAARRVSRLRITSIRLYLTGIGEGGARDTLATLRCMAGWTGLEPATSDVTGLKSRCAAQRLAEIPERLTVTRADKGRHETTRSDGLQ